MIRESNRSLVERAAEIAATLERLYPEARISLDFGTPWQCLVATILSAQCTDERVNRVTPGLFAHFPDPRSIAEAPTARIEELIVTTGFFRQKTRAIRGAARAVVDRFGGRVPSRMEDLLTLPGVGRKTANVLLSHVFGRPGLVVDTHVRRLARRLGLTRHGEPEKIERDLQGVLPEAEWSSFSMRLILHGRAICAALTPRCEKCLLAANCPKTGVETLRRKKVSAKKRRI